MNFCWVTLSVKDLEKSLEFYHGLLGLNIFQRFGSPNTVETAMLGEAETPKIELLCNKMNRTPNQTAGSISIGFEVESLDKTMEYVKSKNITIKRGPLSPSPDVRFFFIDDPDGFEVQLVEHKH